jgi:hypothetical protein
MAGSTIFGYDGIIEPKERDSRYSKSLEQTPLLLQSLFQKYSNIQIQGKHPSC